MDTTTKAVAWGVTWSRNEEQDVNMNSDTRLFAFATTGNEPAAIIHNASWLLIAILICVLADFRYGWGESGKHYSCYSSNGASPPVKFKFAELEELGQFYTQAMAYVQSVLEKGWETKDKLNFKLYET